MDPHYFGRIRFKLKIRIQIRTNVISWIRARIRSNFADDKPKCMEDEPI
jgi:hypothetical protein